MECGSKKKSRSQPTAERLLSVGMPFAWRDDYDVIFRAIRSHCEDAVVLPHPLPGNELLEVFTYASIDNSIYTALSHDLHLFYDGNGDVMAVRLCFFEDPEQTEKNRVQIERIVDTLVEYALDHVETDAMRVAFFANLLGKSVEYPNEVFNMKPAEHSNEIARLQSLAGVFLDKRAICHGLARALSLLCGRAGIECWTVLGQLKGASELECALSAEVPLKHAWNIVEIDGMRAYVDIVLVQSYLAERDNGIDFFPLFFDDDIASKLGYEPWTRPLPQTLPSLLTDRYAFVRAA